MSASMFVCFRDGGGEVLQRPDYLADFSRVYASDDIHLLAKLERGQTFKEPGTPSWEAFASGDWAEALRLIEDDRESVAAYFRDASQRGLTFRRLRVVEYPVTPYLQWEMNVLRLRSELGEEIRVLDSRHDLRRGTGRTGARGRHPRKFRDVRRDLRRRSEGRRCPAVHRP